MNYLFDKKDVYSWSNASVELIGAKGFFGNSLSQLQYSINKNYVDTVEIVNTDKETQTNNVFFAKDTGQYRGLFIPISKVKQV